MEMIKQMLNECGIPLVCIPVLIAIIILTEETKTFFKAVEKIVEEKKGKEIKFFDHTKIIFLVFWTLIFETALALGSEIEWKKFPLYFLFFIGGGSFFYELLIKKIKKIGK